MRARSISSQCYCCVSTDMDDDSRGKIVNCVSACNKVNRMEHVFASAMLLLLVLVLVLLTFNLQHLSLSPSDEHTYTLKFSIFSMGRALFKIKLFFASFSRFYTFSQYADVIGNLFTFRNAITIFPDDSTGSCVSFLMAFKCMLFSKQ